REACMILSSAYVTSMGVIVPLTTPETVVISDELNHNCIINALRLSRPAQKLIFRHNDMKDLEDKLKEAVGKGESPGHYRRYLQYARRPQPFR
ncbi:MAG TPA: aminotransferase class I/II-fold pyridoxal phosphate-dependent enzyme, partial [Candidatus Mcinerneyibacteriales bacterium]|nr:aminotransferase class I/II-fold pyridoxal phosphate-dependent enzyme [Candidatus Mcinerneyibacteriales bacterium]